MRFTVFLPLLTAFVWLTACSQPGSLGVSGGVPNFSGGYEVKTISSKLIQQQARTQQTQERTRIQNTQHIVSADSKQKPYGYRVGPGDVLFVRTLEKNQSAYVVPSGLSNKQIGSTVSESGTIFYPLVGEVPVKDKTADEIRSI